MTSRTSSAVVSAEQQRLVIKVLKARDHYEVLGVGRKAWPDEISKAFKNLALKLHPDKNKAEGAEDAFKTASQAHAALSDPQKRALYDRWVLGVNPTRSGWGSASGSSYAGQAARPDAACQQQTQHSDGCRNFVKELGYRCCCMVETEPGQPRKWSWQLAVMDALPCVLLGCLFLI